jgi:acetylornithine deacetylase
MTDVSHLADDLCARVDEARVAGSLSEMVSIVSVNPFDETPVAGTREREFADWFCARMASLGLDVGTREVVEGRPNVWGTRKGASGGRSLMLAGHMDTVGVEGYQDAFSGTVENGHVYGRGACDMKAALAAYLEAVEVLNDAGVSLAGDLIVGGVADEEHLMIGSKDWGANGPHADFGIIGEPTELAVCPAHKGQVCLFVRTYGKAVHSSMPERGENAIVRMAQVIAAFADFDDELRAGKPHPLCGHGRYSPGVIKGGTISSSVPDFCELEIDRRFLPGQTREEIIAQYRARIDPLVEADPHFRYEIAGPTLDIPALDIAVDAEIVQVLARACETVTGSPARVEAFPGGTDAPNMGFPCVICGPGALAQAHTTNEFVSTAELADATRVYLRAIVELVGLN